MSQSGFSTSQVNHLKKERLRQQEIVDQERVARKVVRKNVFARNICLFVVICKELDYLLGKRIFFAEKGVAWTISILLIFFFCRTSCYSWMQEARQFSI